MDRASRQNRRNPRQGIETHIYYSLRDQRVRVRIDEIPVRGLKLNGLCRFEPVCRLVRIDEIPVRGLKPLVIEDGRSPSRLGQNRRNPRQGIETCMFL